MKKYIINLLMVIASVLGTASCNDVILNESEARKGWLSVSIDRDDEVFVKALSAPDQDMAFEIKIYKGQELVAEVADHRTVTTNSPVELPIGKYKVTASYGDNAIGFDSPCYYGETEVTVKTNAVAEAQLVCSLANVMVTVEFDETLTDNFPTRSVEIGDGKSSGTLVYSQALGNLEKVGYIPATGNLVWKLNLKNVDGVSYVTSGSYADVKPRQHYNLRFTLAEDAGEGGYAAIRLIIDNDLVQEEYDVELDFSESELPSFTANDGFELTNDMSVIVGDESPKELTFAAPEGIKSFILRVDEAMVTRTVSPLAWYELVEASAETIDFLAAMGIRTQSVPYGATSVVVDITDYVKNLPTGDYNVDFLLYDTKGHASNCPMDISVISEVDADMVNIIPWAEFAIVKGKYFSASAPEGITFMYRKTSETSWISVPSSALKIDAATKTFEAEIGDLTGGTSYVIKAVTAADTDTREVEFNTETAPTLYNLSFDDWYKDGKVYYPYAKGTSPNVWDTANTATASFGDSGTVSETSHVVSGSAAKLKSQYVVIAFAAGNLYTGNFGKIDGLGAELYWGTPFNGRPMALRGYYDYSPKEIDNVESPYKSMKGEMDKCQILVFITDWTSQFTINTTDGVFVDYSDPSIIAVGKYESDETTGGYREFTIPLEYRDNTRKPAYIVITACASYLGDYFTGGEGSTLYVDEFSFEYDVTKLTDEEKAKVNYR